MRLGGLSLIFHIRVLKVHHQGRTGEKPHLVQCCETKAIDYGENKDHLAVPEFNSSGGLNTGDSCIYGLKLKKGKCDTFWEELYTCITLG